MVAFTFERLIVVRYPLKRHAICTIRRAKIIIACLTVVAAVVQIVSLYTTGVIENKPNNNSSQVGHRQLTLNDTAALNNATAAEVVGDEEEEEEEEEEEDQSSSYHQMMRIIILLETIVTLVIPPVSIVVMNSLIINGLLQFKKTFKSGANKHHRSSTTRAKTVVTNIEVSSTVEEVQLINLFG